MLFCIVVMSPVIFLGLSELLEELENVDGPDTLHYRRGITATTLTWTLHTSLCVFFGLAIEKCYSTNQYSPL